MITLLDGGMGYELKLRGVKVPDYTKSIWSALALLEDPEAVVDVHLAYIEAGAVAAVDHLEPATHLVNCCGANFVTAALPELRKFTTGPIGGYANAEHVTPDDGDDRVDVDADVSQRKAATYLNPDAYGEEVQRWLDAGAGVVGGCCGTRPKHIRRLREILSAG